MAGLTSIPTTRPVVRMRTARGERPAPLATSTTASPGLMPAASATASANLQNSAGTEQRHGPQRHLPLPVHDPCLTLVLPSPAAGRDVGVHPEEVRRVVLGLEGVSRGPLVVVVCLPHPVLGVVAGEVHVDPGCWIPARGRTPARIRCCGRRRPPLLVTTTPRC
jgi:hypothetical protein